MNCQNCAKIFCRFRDKKENCKDKITFLQAGIIDIIERKDERCLNFLKK